MSDITNQEVQKIQQALKAWEVSDVRDPEIPGTEKNIVTLGRQLLVKLRAGVKLDELTVATVVENLKLRNMLDIDKEAASREAALTLPHANDPSLKWLKSVEDYLEVEPEKVRRFTQAAAFAPSSKGASGKTLNERFNERVQFLQKHKIRRPEEAPKTPAQELQEKASAELQGYIDECRSIIDGLRPQDFRSVGSRDGQMGLWAKGTTKLNNLLNDSLRALPNWQWTPKGGESRPATIKEKGTYLVELIRTEADNLTSTSIR